MPLNISRFVIRLASANCEIYYPANPQPSPTASRITIPALRQTKDLNRITIYQYPLLLRMSRHRLDLRMHAIRH
jgi:hypothetical protein